MKLNVGVLLQKNKSIKLLLLVLLNMYNLKGGIF